jgi:hypothetical protein
MGGWKSRNEVRREENMNAGPEELDQFYEPKNLGIAGQESPTAPAPQPPAQDQSQARLLEIARYQAKRLAQKEVAAIIGCGATKGAAQKFASSPEKWDKWLSDWYAEHAREVSSCLRIPYDLAQGHCARHEAAVRASLSAVETFPDDAESLVRLALGGSNA